MLSGGALDRSNNPYITSIVLPCVSKNQKEISTMWVLLGKNPEKGRRQWKKVNMSGICVFLCV